MSYRKIHIAGLIFLTMVASVARASHIAGGEMIYRFIKDTTIGGVAHQRYEVTLYLYQDCVSGSPDAIAQDNPAFFTVYDIGGGLIRVDTNVYYDSAPGSGGSVTVPQEDIITPCGTVHTEEAGTCLMRKKFSIIYDLKKNNNSYVVVYQRCCRPSSVANLTDPGERGMTFFCIIPGENTAVKNTSAVFNNYPSQVICLTEQMQFDLGATDSDGDSLSYEFSPIFEGASGPDIKPKIASPPPYDTAMYVPPLYYNKPMPAAGPVMIDPVTGILNVTPGSKGIFQMCIACNEWRNGKQINSVRREFQWRVINCKENGNDYRPDAGINTTILVGDTVHFHAKNVTRCTWYPGKFLNNAYSADPIGKFTEPGEFTYILRGENDKGCESEDTITVFVKEHTEFTAPNAFTPNGDGLNDVLIPMAVGKSTLKTFKVYNRWGIELYTTSAPGAGWDGTYRGRQQDPATYAWFVEYIDSFGEIRVQGGNTILMR